MAEKLPTFQDEDPIVQDVKVASRAPGYEALAAGFGAIEKTSEAIGEDYMKEKSNAMYLQTSAQMEHIRSQANVKVIQDPANSETYYKNANDQMKTVLDAAQVSSADRAKLNFNMTRNSDILAVKAAEATHRQAALGTQLAIYDSYDASLQTFGNLNATDPQKAQEYYQDHINKYKSAVMAGAITPIEEMKFKQGFAWVAQSQARTAEVARNPDATAQHYQTEAARTSAINPPDATPAGTPMDEHTKFHVVHYNNTASYQEVEQGLLNRNSPDWLTMSRLTDDQQQNLIHISDGIATADGFTVSGKPLPIIDAEIKRLTDKDTYQTPEDKAEKYALETWRKGLSQNLTGVVAQSPDGAAMIQDNITRVAAIHAAGDTPDVTAQKLAINNDRFNMGKINWAQGRMIPSAEIVPDHQDAIMADSGFKLNGNADTSLQTLFKYSDRTRPFLLNGITNPAHRAVLETVANSEAPMDMRRDLIYANSESVNPVSGKPIDTKYEMGDIEKDAKGGKLNTQVATTLQPIFKLMDAQYSAQDARLIKEGLLTSAVRYVKYISAKHDDYTLSGMKDYLSQVQQLYGSAYHPKTGTNYIVNDVPAANSYHLDDKDHAALAQFAVTQGYDAIKQKSDHNHFGVAQDYNPLMMTISPTQEVQAVDGNGNVFWRQQLTGEFLQRARREYKAPKPSEQFARGFVKSFGQEIPPNAE